MIELIEDCSPYFIRYRHTDSDKIIDLSKKFKVNQVDGKYTNKFVHHRLPLDDAEQILNYIPYVDQFSFLKTRVSLFVTQPRFYYRPHKDGLSCKMGINYIVDVKDNKCVTSWYDDEQFAGRPIDTLEAAPIGKARSREIGDYNRSLEWDKIVPVKSMVAKQNDVILFNVDLFHDVNNYRSPNERTILTLRSTNDNIDFFAARKILFNY